MAFFALVAFLGLAPAASEEGTPSSSSRSTLIVLVENNRTTDTAAVVDAACAMEPGSEPDPCLWKRFTSREACITNDPQHHDPSKNPKHVRVMFNTTSYRGHKARLWYFPSTNCPGNPSYRVARCDTDTYYTDLDCRAEGGDYWFELLGAMELTKTCEMTMGDQKVEATIDRLESDYYYFRFEPVGSEILGCGVFIDSGEDEWASTGTRLVITNDQPAVTDLKYTEKTIPSGGDTITRFTFNVTWLDPEGDDIVERSLTLYNPEGAKIETCASDSDELECELHNADRGNYRLVAFARDEFGAYQETELYVSVAVPIIDLKLVDVSGEQVTSIQPKQKVTFVVTSSGEPVPDAIIEVRDAESKNITTQAKTGADGRFEWDSSSEAILNMAYFVGDLEVVAFKEGFSTAISTLKLVSKLSLADLPPSACRGVTFKLRAIDAWGQGVVRREHVSVRMYDGATEVGSPQTPDEHGYVTLTLPSDYTKASIDVVAKGPPSGMYYSDSDKATLAIAQKGIDVYIYPLDTCLSASIYVHLEGRCYAPGTYFDVYVGDKKQGTCPAFTSADNGGVAIGTNPEPWCRLAVDTKTTTGAQPLALKTAASTSTLDFTCKSTSCKLNVAATCSGSSCSHTWGAALSTGIATTGQVKTDIDAKRAGPQICPGDVMQFTTKTNQYNILCSDGCNSYGSFNSYARISRCGDIPATGSNPTCHAYQSPIVDMGGKTFVGGLADLSTSSCRLCKDGSCTSGGVTSPGVIAYLRNSGNGACNVWGAGDTIEPANYVGPKAPGAYSIFVDTVTRVCDGNGHYACPDCGDGNVKPWGCDQYSDSGLSKVCMFGSAGSAKSADGWNIGQGDIGFEVMDPQLAMTKEPDITNLCPGASISFSYTVTCASTEASVYLDKVAPDAKIGTCNAGGAKAYKTEAPCTIKVPESAAFGRHKVLVASDINGDGKVVCDPTTCAFDVANCECGEFYVQVQKPQIAIYDPRVDLDLNICPEMGDPMYFKFTSQCTTELRKISLLFGADHDDRTFTYKGEATPSDCELKTKTCGEGATSCEGSCLFTPAASFGPDVMDRSKYELHLYNAAGADKGFRQVGIWRSADVVLEGATVTTAVPDGYDEWPKCSPGQIVRVTLTNKGDGIAYLKNGFDLYDYITNYDPVRNELKGPDGTVDAAWKANICSLIAMPLSSNTLRPQQSRILVYKVECNPWQFMQSSFFPRFTLVFKYQDLCKCSTYDSAKHTRLLPDDPEARYCKQVARDAQGEISAAGTPIEVTWLGAGSACRLKTEKGQVTGYCSPDDDGACVEPLASEPSPCFPGHCGAISDCLFNQCCRVGADGKPDCGICEECGTVKHIDGANGCEEGEDCLSNPKDCGACPNTCGNGRCDSALDAECPSECEANGACDLVELRLDPAPVDWDCQAPVYVCGDHNCQTERGESTKNCHEDCCGFKHPDAGDQGVCKDGSCSYWESWKDSADCKRPDACGVPDPITKALVCDTLQGESCEGCPSDCGPCESCNGNAKCEPEKGEGSECADCAGSTCPDGVCEAEERSGLKKCPADCYTPLPPTPEASAELAEVAGAFAEDGRFVLDGSSSPPVLSLRTNLGQSKVLYLKVTNALPDKKPADVEVNVSTGIKALATLPVKGIAYGESRLVRFTVSSITDLQVKYGVYVGGAAVYYDSWISTTVDTNVDVKEVTTIADDATKELVRTNMAVIVTCAGTVCKRNSDSLSYTLEEGKTMMTRFFGVDNQLAYDLELAISVFDSAHKAIPGSSVAGLLKSGRKYVLNVTTDGIATYYLHVKAKHCMSGSCLPTDSPEDLGEVTVFVVAALSGGELVGVREGGQGVFYQNTELVQQAAIGMDYIEAVVANTADTTMDCAISFSHADADGDVTVDKLDLASIGGCTVEPRTTKIVRIPVSGPVKGELIVETQNCAGSACEQRANKVVNKIPITVGGFEATVSEACFVDKSNRTAQQSADCDRSMAVKTNVITTGPGEIIDVPVFIKNPTDFNMAASIQVVSASGKDMVIKKETGGTYYNITLPPRSSKYVVLPVSGPADFTVRITSLVCKAPDDCQKVVQNIPFKVDLKVGGYRMGTCRYPWECVSGNCIKAVGRCCKKAWFWSPLKAMCVEDLPYIEVASTELVLTVGEMRLYPVFVQNPYQKEIDVSLSFGGSATSVIGLDCAAQPCKYKLMPGEQQVVQVPVTAGKVGTSDLVIESVALTPSEVKLPPINVKLVVLSASTGGSDLVTAPAGGLVEAAALGAFAAAWLGRRRERAQA